MILDALTNALDAFKAEQERPTMIIVKSIIGYGAPTKQGSHSAHGEPLGVEEIRGAKRFYGWPEDESFLVPDKVRSHFADLGKRGADLRGAWDELFARYSEEYPELADHLDKMQRRQLPEGWDADLPEYPTDPKGAAGRDTSQKVLNIVAQTRPVADRRFIRSRAVQQVALSPSRAPATSSPTTEPAATCTSESANTPLARSRTGWHSARSGPTRPGS